MYKLGFFFATDRCFTLLLKEVCHLGTKHVNVLPVKCWLRLYRYLKLRVVPLGVDVSGSVADRRAGNC